MRTAHLVLLPLAILVASVAASAQSYPRIDESTHWSIPYHGYDDVQELVWMYLVDKNILTSGSTSEYRRVFNYIVVAGATIDGVDRQFSGYTYHSSYTYSGYKTVYGQYSLSGVGTSLYLSFYFYKDGRFTVSCYYPSATTVTVKVPIQFDYDLNGAGDDVCEFVWNAGSHEDGIHPPTDEATVTFSPRDDGNVDYWAASPNEIKVQYPATTAESGTVDLTAICRVFDAATAGTQLGMVFWGNGSAYDVVIKQYQEAWEISPAANPNNAVQQCYSQTLWPRYAYSGSNQRAFVIVTKGLNQYSTSGLIARLFQRETGRPLKYTVHYHPLTPYGEENTWALNPDYVVKTVNQQDRTLRTGLAQLTGNSDLLNLTCTQNIYTGGVWDGPGGSIDVAELHAYMQTFGGGDHSAENMRNVREWKADLYALDWTIDRCYCRGVMFDLWDEDWPRDANLIGREAAAVCWPLMHYGIDGAYQRKELIRGLLHEGGHCFNMQHEWSSCHGTEYGWCTLYGRAATIMSYYRHDQQDHTMLYNNEQDDGDRRVPTWYQQGPESWVKPGRYGRWFDYDITHEVIPGYQTY